MTKMKRRKHADKEYSNHNTVDVARIENDLFKTSM